MASNGFWTGAGNGSVVTPKRQSRWILRAGGIPAWVCKSVTKPSFSIGESAHRFMNHTFYYPGRLEWNSIDITLVDPLDPDISRALLNITRRAGYNSPINEEMAQSIISKSGFIGALGTIQLQQLGPPTTAQSAAQSQDNIDARSSVVIEEWKLKNAWVQDVSFGSLSYDSDELVEIAVKIRYDFADATFFASGGSVNLFK
jgi:hypothetical protein